jgi:hypothetical protein
MLIEDSKFSLKLNAKLKNQVFFTFLLSIKFVEPVQVLKSLSYCSLQDTSILYTIK